MEGWNTGKNGKDIYAKNRKLNISFIQAGIEPNIAL